MTYLFAEPVAYPVAGLSADMVAEPVEALTMCIQDRCLVKSDRPRKARATEIGMTVAVDLSLGLATEQITNPVAEPVEAITSCFQELCLVKPDRPRQARATETGKAMAIESGWALVTEPITNPMTEPVETVLWDTNQPKMDSDNENGITE